MQTFVQVWVIRDDTGYIHRNIITEKSLWWMDQSSTSISFSFTPRRSFPKLYILLRYTFIGSSLFLKHLRIFFAQNPSFVNTDAGFCYPHWPWIIIERANLRSWCFCWMDISALEIDSTCSGSLNFSLPVISEKEKWSVHRVIFSYETPSYVNLLRLSKKEY